MEEERSVNADAHSSRSLYTRIRYVAAQFSSHMQAFALASPWHLHIRGFWARPDWTPGQGLAICSVECTGMIHQSGLPNLQPLHITSFLHHAGAANRCSCGTASPHPPHYPAFEMVLFGRRLKSAFEGTDSRIFLAFWLFGAHVTQSLVR